MSFEPANQAELFSWLPDAWLVLDTQHRVVSCNRAYRELLRLGPADLTGRSVFDINQFGSEHQRNGRARVLEQLLVGLEPGMTRTTPEFRYDLPPPSGEPDARFWEIVGSVIEPAPGQRFIALRVDDVMQRVEQRHAEQRERARLRSQARLRQFVAIEAQQKFEESRAQFEQVLELARVGAWQRDLLTGEIVCTEQCKLNLGLRRDEHLDATKLFSEVIHADDRERVLGELRKAIVSGGTFEYEYRLAADPSRWILAGGQVQCDQKGDAVRLNGFALDITGRMAAEIEQRDIAGQERRARENSDRHALAMDHFLAAVTHELRSPLGVILNWAQLLEMSAGELDVARASKTIQRNAKQLAFMVDDLLDTGAIISGNLTIRTVPLALDTLVSNVATDLLGQAQRKGIELRIAALSPATINGDEARIKQIVWNLVTNAIKFCDEGYVELSLAREEGLAVLKVRDTGRGIDPRSIGTIFDRFAQVNPENSSRIRGLGLGLWLARNLVDRQGGAIYAESEGLGQGAMFTVALPLA